jgi:hypothetical protein
MSNYFTHTDMEKTMNDYAKQMQDFMAQMTEAMTAAMPKVKTNKNGYEIRTKVLEIAKDMEQFEFHAKFAGWEQTVERDTSTGQIITTVKTPDVPSADQVLATAQKFYDFINNTSSNKKSS